ncbi:integral membrane sensor signal transductionhistidine kinase [Striga asiatica]|uniref:Integral membrane sensor signal transductionhistidine kinase n=1 Tax=Striga asiatica TaxID=4170 RepID=A0A5A7PBT0_STRAF|nr:integral membrane sensor signal transductionhistidine kinase [Striga asiatica]
MLSTLFSDFGQRRPASSSTAEEAVLAEASAAGNHGCRRAADDVAVGLRDGNPSDRIRLTGGCRRIWKRQRDETASYRSSPLPAAGRHTTDVWLRTSVRCNFDGEFDLWLN